MLDMEYSKRFTDGMMWDKMSDRELVIFQLSNDLLCCPWGIFHEKVEKVLGRPVWTHEFANMQGLLLEVFEGTTEDKNPIATLVQVMKDMEDK